MGIAGIKLYEGTKHTMATDAGRRGVSERALQTFLGHSDARSTRRYARMSDEALVSVLRPRDVEGDEDLSLAGVARSQARERPNKIGVPNGNRTRGEAP